MTEAEANTATILDRMLGPYSVLRGNRNLQLLFGGQVVSAFGDWLYVLALAVLAYNLTGSTSSARLPGALGEGGVQLAGNFSALYDCGKTTEGMKELVSLFSAAEATMLEGT